MNKWEQLQLKIHRGKRQLLQQNTKFVQDNESSSN